MLAVMATREEAFDAILDKIIELTNAIAPGSGSSPHSVASSALAVNHLAEALAWLQSPGHDHGGTANANDGA
jgi:hypothetical protein